MKIILLKNNYLQRTLYIFIILILISCNRQSKLHKQLADLWIIDLCIINEKDYALTGFSSNTIILNEDNTCILPKFYQDGDFRGQKYAKWQLIDSIGMMFLVIKDANNILSNHYNLKCLYNQQNNLHTILLENEDMNIKLMKLIP